MWRFYKCEYMKNWWVIPLGFRNQFECYRLDVEKEMDISVLCWHFRFLKYR